MRGSTAALITACAIAGIAALAVCSWQGYAAWREIRHVQAHIARAERIAQERDVSAMSVEKRARRARLLAVLRTYRERGVFPKNCDFPGLRVPYFVDAAGVRCAMAYLIESTGDWALVKRIANTHNNAYVRELATEARLVAWLDRNGITIDEAACIQPQYSYQRREETTTPGQVAAIATYYTGEASGILLNLHVARTARGRAWRGAWGIAAGFTGTMIGVVATLLSDGRPDVVAFGVTGIAIGATSIAMGAHQLGSEPPKRPTAQLIPVASPISNGLLALGVRVSF